MNNLIFEEFKGVGQLNELKFFRYKVVGKGEIDNVHKAIWGVKYRLQSNNFFR